MTIPIPSIAIASGLPMEKWYAAKTISVKSNGFIWSALTKSLLLTKLLGTVGIAKS